MGQARAPRGTRRRRPAASAGSRSGIDTIAAPPGFFRCSLALGRSLSRARAGHAGNNKGSGDRLPLAAGWWRRSTGWMHAAGPFFSGGSVPFRPIRFLLKWGPRRVRPSSRHKAYKSGRVVVFATPFCHTMILS